MAQLTEVFTRDNSSGMVHRRWSTPGKTELLSYEDDNLDDAGAYTIIKDLSDVDYAALCKRCFTQQEKGNG